jgi:DNA-binding XRE family transcriptional regulator
LDGHTRRLKLYVGDPRHCQCVGDIAPLLRELLVVAKAQQHMGGFASPPMHTKTPADLRADLARNLRSIRLGKGLAQERLALEAGVDRTVVSKIERAVTNPSLEILLRLANHLEVEVVDLLRTT